MSENINKSQISEALQIQAFKSPEELLPQTFEDKEHTKNTKNAKNKGFLNKLIARDSL